MVSTGFSVCMVATVILNCLLLLHILGIPSLFGNAFPAHLDRRVYVWIVVYGIFSVRVSFICVASNQVTTVEILSVYVFEEIQ